MKQCWIYSSTKTIKNPPKKIFTKKICTSQQHFFTDPDFVHGVDFIFSVLIERGLQSPLLRTPYCLLCRVRALSSWQDKRLLILNSKTSGSRLFFPFFAKMNTIYLQMLLQALVWPRTSAYIVTLWRHCSIPKLFICFSNCFLFFLNL